TPGERPCFHPSQQRAAFARALATGLRATTAMLHVVALALLGAPFAHAGAQGGYLAGELAVTGHIGRSEAADFGAIEIELDAARELVAVGFEEAGLGAIAARIRAGVARLDARSKVLV